MIRFLTEDIWKSIKALSSKSRRRKVAVAYFGAGGAKLLKPKKGDILLVSMTMGNVMAGQVNPFEIEKLYKKGVLIFNLANLHAKIFLFGKSVIVGSANVSLNSSENLIEAGILTDDKKVVRGAEKFFADNCVERIKSDYIRLCKKNYAPPKFFGAKRKRASTKFKGQLSPFWVLSTIPLKRDDKPEDVKLYNKRLPIFRSQLKNIRNYEIEKIYYPINDRIIKEIKPGDIFIQIYCHTVKTEVYEPSRVLGVIKNDKTQKAQLLFEQKKNPVTKQWKPLERKLWNMQVKGIKRKSSRRILNENTKKLLLDYFK